MEEILHQLKTVVYPIIYRVSTIQGGAGFLPSTVVHDQMCGSAIFKQSQVIHVYPETMASPTTIDLPDV